MLKHEAKLNAFFKFFEIPELWDIELLQKKTADWEDLDKPPTIGLRKSNKSYYRSMHDQNEYVILITMPDGGIDKYNIKTNTSMHITDFPDKFECDGAETAINPSNGDIYIIGGKKKCFGIYNIESNKWDIKCLNEFDDNDECIKYDVSEYSNQPKIINNTLYVTGWKCIRKYIAKNGTFIEIHDDELYPSFDHQTKLIYIPRINKYIQFGNLSRDSSYIYTENVLENQVWIFGKHEYIKNELDELDEMLMDEMDGDGDGDGDKKEENEIVVDKEEDASWKWSKIGLPMVYKTLMLGHIAYFENIVVLMYFTKDVNQSELWFLEINEEDINKSKYWKNKGNLRQTFPRYFMFVANDGYIHCINFEGEDNNDNNWDDGNLRNDFMDKTPFHLKVSLMDMIPDKLKDKYKIKYSDLINGFIRTMIKIDDSDDLSDVLPLIQSYYSVFA